MESHLATTQDADLVLKLYDMRREATLRKARHWVMFDFHPKTAEEIVNLWRDFSSERSDWLRMVVSYWEMAASLVVHGAVNADLYLDTNGEGIYLYNKLEPFIEEIQKINGGLPFLRNTTTLLEKFPSAKDRLQRIRAYVAHRTAQQQK
jgi:hypothetical protein